MLASQDAFEGILFDSWLHCFEVIKLRGHEDIIFGSRSVPEEVGHCLMDDFKQEKPFYPNRAIWRSVMMRCQRWDGLS